MSLPLSHFQWIEDSIYRKKQGRRLCELIIISKENVKDVINKTLCVDIFIDQYRLVSMIDTKYAPNDTYSTENKVLCSMNKNI